MKPPDLMTATLALAGLAPLALLWVRSGRWVVAAQRAFRTGAAGAAVCALGAAWAGSGPVLWVALGGLLPLALVGAALARADARERLLRTQQHMDRFRLLDAALNASRDGVLVTASHPYSVGLQIIYANPAFENLTGYGTDEALGQSPSMLYAESSDPDREKVQTALRVGTAGRFEVLARRKDGTRVWVEWDVVPVPGAPDGFEYRVAVLRDTTERRRLEEQLRHAAKLEVVGRLAAGVAHDFNNLLTVIGGNADLLGELADGTPGAAQLVEEVRGATDRAGRLVRQLLTFSRPRTAGREVLDLGRVVSDLGGIIARVVGTKIATEVAVPDGPVPVRADRGELEQVVMNLAVNARDAMPDGGRLRLRVRAGHGSGRLEVGDSGCGMTEAVKARIFEPFFTTKEPEKGTGLGLATVRQVADRCGGRVAVESAPGRGTTFFIDLPLCAPPEPAPAGPTTGSAVRASEASLLLVDDEPGVRALARTILQARGYHVTEAADGAAALALLDAGHEFDLLVTDVRMPGATGGEVAARAREVLSGIGVVFVSAFTDAPPSVPGSVFVHKPFAPAELVQAVERVGSGARDRADEPATARR